MNTIWAILRLRQVIRRQHKALATEENYVLVPELVRQMNLAQAVGQQDKQERTPVMLPHRLTRKYPEYQFSWPWAWVLPAHHPCRDPRT